VSQLKKVNAPAPDRELLAYAVFVRSVGGRSNMIDKVKPDETKRLTLAQLKRFSSIDASKVWYTVKDNKTKKSYLLERRGKCDPVKCKSACCKFCHVGSVPHSYWSGFGDFDGEGVSIKVTCKHLNTRTNKCAKWKKKTFPRACDQFPHPNDQVYHLVYSKCSFYFVELGELKLK
jgi:hypothetical protein